VRLGRRLHKRVQNDGFVQRSTSMTIRATAVTEATSAANKAFEEYVDSMEGYKRLDATQQILVKSFFVGGFFKGSLFQLETLATEISETIKGETK